MTYRDHFTNTVEDAAAFERDHHAEPREVPTWDEVCDDDVRGRGDGYGPIPVSRDAFAPRTDLHRIDPDHDDIPF